MKETFVIEHSGRKYISDFGRRGNSVFWVTNNGVIPRPNRTVLHGGNAKSWRGLYWKNKKGQRFFQPIKDGSHFLLRYDRKDNPGGLPYVEGAEFEKVVKSRTKKVIHAKVYIVRAL